MLCASYGIQAILKLQMLHFYSVFAADSLLPILLGVDFKQIFILFEHDFLVFYKGLKLGGESSEPHTP